MTKLRDSRGGAYESRGKFYMRVTTGPQKRDAKLLPWCTSLPDALARANATQALVARLRVVDHGDFVENLVKSAATADDEKMAALEKAVAGIEAGVVKREPILAREGGPITFAKFAEQWTKGDLHRLYPDHVRKKRTSGDDVERLALVAPLIGAVPLARFTLDDADRAMAGLEERRKEGEREAARLAKREPQTLAPLSPSSRRHYAQLIGRVLKLAVYPGRHIAATPIPKGWLPRPSDKKARSFVYPSEDATLMACKAEQVPVWRRLLWGFIAREGTRGPSEALSLRWRHLDLVRGVVRLDVNKTDDPRFWTLNYAVASALRAWRELRRGGREDAEMAGELVFVDEDGAQANETQLAGLLREDLKAAGIDRPELFEHNAHRLQLRAHDLRGSFVTVALANGRSETWVTDRTGHTTSGQLMNYRRAARSVHELDLGDWADLDAALRGGERGGNQFQRVDSNHDKRNQNPLSCH